MQVNINNILKVYNGRCGCMCGCLGKYTSPAESVRSVKIIAKKVLTNPAVKFEDNYAYVEDRANNKMQVIYFASEEAMKQAQIG